ncbi:MULTISPECIES: MFS transporter [Micromonospora]|uniref:MFS transporter n=1 Tax=Micromonospora solifontis TaxID=2487138 RepID=A0ABX9WD53_9ACTN|nr:MULTISPECIES: MFS transporter [Micromonospora]NES16306.1 MFS transporter [Micromonospora sp. PPF5-17B]NES38366.1 MFS transporter [Micromonospora solifontis]NES58118.1 MFS transporter [Micromonospora sp. PPF5-6]RNL95895.1 MFS transporter [Micromonospora solifontis]
MSAEGAVRPPADAAAYGVPSYRDLNVLRWLTGFGVSLLGDQVYFVALAWAAVQSTGARGTGLVLAVGSVPRLVLLLVGGAFVDRWGARRLMLGSDMLRGAVMAAAALIIATSSPSLLVLVSVAVVFGVVDAMFLPAVGALPQRLVAAEELARLQGMRMLVQRAAIVVGAPLGGATVAAFGVAAAFAVNAVSFGVSVLALASVRLRPNPHLAGGAEQRNHALLTDVRDGLRVVRRSALLRTALLTAAVSELGFSGPINVGVPLLVRDRGWQAAGVGLIIGGFGAGAALAALALVVIGRLPRTGLAYAVLSLAMAAALAGIGYGPSRLWAVTAAVLLGAGGGVASAILLALVQAYTPAAYLGRAFSLSSLASFGGIPVSYAMTGFAVDALDPRAAFAGGAALAACGGLISLLTPALRRAELPDRKRPGRHPPGRE